MSFLNQDASQSSHSGLVNGGGDHIEKSSYNGGKSNVIGAHDNIDELHLTSCLSLLNGVLEYRKGSRVNGECNSWGMFS